MAEWKTRWSVTWEPKETRQPWQAVIDHLRGEEILRERLDDPEQVRDWLEARQGQTLGS